MGNAGQKLARNFSEQAKKSPALATTLDKFHSPITVQSVIPTISLATANSQEILRHNIRNQIEKYNAHSTDTGSTPVQIAVITEKIQNLTRHALAHKKDKNSLRSFTMLVSKRARLMKYLRKNDLKLYKQLVSDFDPLLNETDKTM